MLRRRRCTSCGINFYAPADHKGTTCQNCSGDVPDKTKDLMREVALIEKVNSQPKDRDQIVNPRTGKTPAAAAEEKARAKKS